jgi:hypothetical protein
MMHFEYILCHRIDFLQLLVDAGADPAVDDDYSDSDDCIDVVPH